ncbi:hypothetical protein M8494_20925 [Serratia ureilytica]
MLIQQSGLLSHLPIPNSVINPSHEMLPAGASPPTGRRGRRPARPADALLYRPPVELETVTAALQRLRSAQHGCELEVRYYAGKRWQRGTDRPGRPAAGGQPDRRSAGGDAGELAAAGYAVARHPDGKPLATATGHAAADPAAAGAATALRTTAGLLSTADGAAIITPLFSPPVSDQRAAAHAWRHADRSRLVRFLPRGCRRRWTTPRPEPNRPAPGGPSATIVAATQFYPAARMCIGRGQSPKR